MSLADIVVIRNIIILPHELDQNLQSNIFERAKESFATRIIGGRLLLNIQSVSKNGYIKVIDHRCQMSVRIKGLSYIVSIGDNIEIKISNGSTLGSYGRDPRVCNDAALFYIPDTVLEPGNVLNVTVVACKIESNMFIAICKIV